jgi:TRAP-type transport system periplasmic protein
MVFTRFAQLVRERSDRTIRVDLEIPAKVLGGELEMLADVRSGHVDIVAVTAPAAGIFLHDAPLIELPYLFDDIGHGRAFIDGSFGQAILDDAERCGLAGMGIVENGFRSFTTRETLVGEPGDVARLRLRVQQSPINAYLAEALGAIGVPLPFPRVHKALNDNKIDAQENSLANIVGLELWRWQKYLTLTRHTFSAHIVLANAEMLAKLGSGATLVHKALRDAIAEHRLAADRLEQELYQVLVQHFKISELNDLQRERFISATALVYERVAQALGNAPVTRVRAAAEAARRVAPHSSS